MPEHKDKNKVGWSRKYEEGLKRIEANKKRRGKNGKERKT